MDNIRYIVEWLTDVPVVDGIGEPDEGVTHSKHFSSLAEAQAWVTKVRPLDYWDCPLISEEHLICDGHRRVWDWIRNHDLD